MTLTDKQKQDIEKEAIEWEKNRPVYGNKRNLINGYIAGATAQLLALNGKDEEIASLRVALGRCKRLCNEEEYAQSERLQLILETATEALKQ